MGIDTNEVDPSYLDVYLTANVEGWVAVGFSLSSNMVCPPGFVRVLNNNSRERAGRLGGIVVS